MMNGWRRTPATNDERTAARRPPELVGADRNEVRAERLEVQRDVAGGRGRVDVHGHAGGPTELHDFGHGLQGPNLVVAPLAIHECRPVVAGVRRAATRDDRGRSGRPSPPARQLPRVRSARPPRGRRSAQRRRRSSGRRAGRRRGCEDGRVGRLGAAACEHDTVRASYRAVAATDSRAVSMASRAT